MDVVFQFIGVLASVVVGIYVLFLFTAFVGMWSAFSGHGMSFVWFIIACVVFAIAVLVYMVVF